MVEWSELRKLYYSISEVAEILGVSATQLRNWQKEFRQIHPQKNRQGERMYTVADIQIIHQVQLLLKDRGFTIEGAKRALSEERHQGELPLHKDKKEIILDRLLAIKAGLEGILKKM